MKYLLTMCFCLIVSLVFATQTYGGPVPLTLKPGRLAVTSHATFVYPARCQTMAAKQFQIWAEKANRFAEIWTKYELTVINPFCPPTMSPPRPPRPSMPLPKPPKPPKSLNSWWD